MIEASLNTEITFTHHFLERAANLNIALLQALEVIASGKMKKLESNFLSFKYKGVEVIICPQRHLAVTITRDEQAKDSNKHKKPLEMSDYEFAMCA